MTRTHLTTHRIAALLLLAVGPVLIGAGPSEGTDVTATPHGRIAEAIDAQRDELVATRHDLHRHPEIAGEEDRTASVVAKHLRELGFDVTTGVGGHGVVGILSGGKPGPVVGFRADMDAVATDLPDPAPYRSVVPGIRHICGHDVHTAVGLGVATGLAAVRDELPGTVKLLFQPAEETATGARAMLDDGAFDEPTPGAVFAVHSFPGPVGTIGAGPGQTLPGRDLAVITLTGEGDLTAAAAAAAELVASLTSPGITPTTSSLDGPFILGQVLRSSAGPGAAEHTVLAQITTPGGSSRDEARRRLTSGLEASSVDGVEARLEYRERLTSGVYNDPAMVERLRPLVTELVGEDSYVASSGTIPFFSEDFGFFQELAPGVMYWLGVSNPETGTRGLPHSPDFVADDEAVLVGARVMATVLFEVLRAESGP